MKKRYKYIGKGEDMPLFKTQNKSYITKIWHESCYYDVLREIAKKCLWKLLRNVFVI